MASFSVVSLLILSLFVATASARPGLPFHPCKTLLVSTYSVSFKPRNLLFPDDHLPRHRRPEFFAVVAEVRDFDFKPHRLFLDDGHRFFPTDRPDAGFIHHETLVPGRPHQHLHDPSSSSDLPLGITGSLRDRTIDVLNVLASLLFGAACGALTAGTMYLIWSLFNSRFDAYNRNADGFSDDDDAEDDDDDIFNPKKESSKVVVAVPAPASVTDSADSALLKKESV